MARDTYNEYQIFENFNKKVTSLIEKNKYLNEDNSNYPNFNQDVQSSIEETKKSLAPFVLTIDPNVKNYNNQNIIMNGSSVIKSFPIKFTYSLDENGVTVSFPENVDQIPLYNEIIDFLIKLKSNYDSWKNIWSQNLSDINGNVE